jgi:flavodoxin
MKSLLVLFSYHHNNTEKIANVFAKVLDAQIKTPRQINPEELQEYSLIGFVTKKRKDLGFVVLWASEGEAFDSCYSNA